MGILLWIVFGLIAGVIAKYIMPGKAPGGILLTIILGIVGGYVGSLLFGVDVTGFDLKSLAVAVGGALLVLVVYGFIAKRA